MCMANPMTVWNGVQLKSKHICTEPRLTRAWLTCCIVLPPSTHRAFILARKKFSANVKKLLFQFFGFILKFCIWKLHKLGCVCIGVTGWCFVGEDKTGKESKKHCHKKELRRIRRKFGLENSDSSIKAIPMPGYEDRAQIRRTTVGSQNHHEKTRTASLEE